MRVPFSYLDRQFADLDGYLDDIKNLARSGDFTLGAAVGEFERRFAALCRMPHAVGVGSGTDALILSLKLLGIGPGDEVITAVNTFIATAGAIAMTGARPVFVDNDEGFVLDVAKLEQAITGRTRAIVPVHYTGNMVNMPELMRIAARRNLTVVEDACQAITASFDGQYPGSWGEAACFSLHPLKNLNVWGDAGVVVTRSDSLDRKLRLFRNHGLINRDEAQFFGHNSRLDSLQAVIGNRLIGITDEITRKRIENARFLDEALAELKDFVQVPHRPGNIKHVYHLYVIRVKRRDDLLRHLHERQIEAKVHYPIPLHLQPASASLGYKSGDFPVAEADSRSIITLPAHPYLTGSELDYMAGAIREFYK